MDDVKFIKAKPVWPAGREKEKNRMVGFRIKFDMPKSGRVVLTIAASSIYRFYINGSFAGFGPARGPHGYYRVDEWDLTQKLNTKDNIIAIEVMGYNVNSYYLLDQPAFLQAEIAGETGVLAATSADSDSFEAFVIKERIQKVQRYSFQRCFVEEYKMEQDWNNWRHDPACPIEKAEIDEFPVKNYIGRHVPYPEFKCEQPLFEVSRGFVENSKKNITYWRDRALINISPTFLGYKEDELEDVLSYEVQEIKTISGTTTGLPYIDDHAIHAGGNSYHLFSFASNLTGFIGCKVKCSKQCRLFFVFDEILTGDDVDFKRLDCVNAIRFDLKPGIYDLESMEPYTLKFLKLIVLNGECVITDIHIREYANPDICNSEFNCDNNALNAIFAAGKETFRQNAIDIYMDNPSRERAGWLCDSFFTARVEADLTGKSLVERNFFENFLLPEKFEYLPEGMLPMCYPADHYDGNFIPNWALWFVIQLEEYLVRTSDRKMVDALKSKVYKMFDYFKPLKNEFGLLEKLDGWVFIEWSKANDLVQDVNYPTNMLYSAALACAGRIYGDAGLLSESELLQKTIEIQSYNGTFFVDNATREGGRLTVTSNTTEVCQYYAFYFNIATPEKYPDLWNILVHKLGPSRKNTGDYPQVHVANAFIGNYLRLEILSRYNLKNKILKEMENFFTYMVEKTGTLWEHAGDYASCDHGFASHVVRCLYRDALGVNRIDTKEKYIDLEVFDQDLNYCEGKIPIADSILNVRWRKENQCIYYHINPPQGYTVTMTNHTELDVIRI